jgi:hypothetical protein
VRFVTRRMILEKQELFTPVFSEVRYMTDDHRETAVPASLRSSVM